MLVNKAIQIKAIQIGSVPNQVVKITGGWGLEITPTELERNQAYPLSKWEAVQGTNTACGVIVAEDWNGRTIVPGAQAG